MNRIYKVIYSKARQCYIVVSELAKSNHKSSQQGADHTNTPALARIIAVALAAGALTWGSVPEVSWAADNTTVTDSNENKVTNTDSNIKDINANITGKNNKVTDSSNAEIVGDGNTVTNKMEGRGDTVRSNDVRIHGSGNFISGSRNQQVIGDNNKIIARDRGTVTDYQHPEGREENVSDLTIGRGNVIQSNDTYRNEWDSLKVIGNNNRADGEWDGYHAGGPSAGIIIGDNQNLNGIQDTIVIGSLAPSEQQEKKEDNGDLYTAGSNNIIIGYHTTTTQNGGIVIGNRSQGSGVFQTIMGPRSIIGNATGNPDSGAGTMASIYGAFNKVEDAGSSNDSGLDIDGLGNSVNGSLNITSNARGTMIMGVGNTITHAKGPDILGKDEDTPGATGYWVSSGLFGADYYAQGADTVAEGNNLNISYDEMRNAWQKYMETSGGAVSVLGNSNNADYAIRSQILGTGNTLQGSETDMSAYNTVSGFANTGTNIKRSAIVGTGNNLKNGEDNVVIGDYHNLENGKHNVILGSMDYTEKQVTKQSKSAWAMTDEHPDGTFEYTVTEQVPVKDHTEDIENAVMVGYNTDAKEDGSVALGSDSIASTKSGLEGYDAQGKKHAKSDKDYAAWVSTDAAVSVGGADREIKYDVLDKDGNPVTDKATGKTKQETQIVKSTRQITNLAAGTEDTDAVNVAQMKVTATAAADAVKTHFYSVNSTDAKAGNYNNNGATGVNAIAAGVGASSDGDSSIAVGTNAKIESNGVSLTSIAIGKNAYVLNGSGNQEYQFSFDNDNWPDGKPNAKGVENLSGGIAIGTNTYARTGSIDVGGRTMKGRQMAGITIDKDGGPSTANIMDMTTVGTNSYNKGLMATIVGSYSINTGDFNGKGGFNSYDYGSQNMGSTIVGSLNQNRSLGKDGTSGVANSIIGVANIAEGANGALIFGAGNKVSNSIGSIYGFNGNYGANTVDDLVDSLSSAVKESESGGSTLVIGGGNTADYTQRTQLIGVNNTITGTSKNISDYNMVDGFNTTANNISHVYTIGYRNDFNNENNSIVIGDYHQLTNGKNNIVIGSYDGSYQPADEYTKTPEKTTYLTNNKLEDAVILGHNANAKFSKGVAIGSGSVASINEKVIGYDPATKKPSKVDSSTWKSTAAAVSVGRAEEKDKAGNVTPAITRQITNVAAGTQDTDAVNVAQLKAINTNIAASKTHFYSVNSTDAKAKNYNNDGATAANALAAGVGANADKASAVAIGDTAYAGSANGVAIGTGSWIRSSDGKPNANGGDVAIGQDSHVDSYVNQGGSIALGQNARVENMYGNTEKSWAFGQTEFDASNIPLNPGNEAGGVAIGRNSFARTGSLMVGSHMYKGAIADIDEVDGTDSQKLRGNFNNINMTTLGTNSFNNGTFATVTGSYSATTANPNKKIQNFAATIDGSLNSIESYKYQDKDAADNSGVASSIVGTANRIANSNNTTVLGAGNEVTNSLTDFTAPTEGGASAKALQDTLKDTLQKDAKGAVVISGIGNKVDSSHGVSVLGSKNVVDVTDNIQLLGDNREVKGANGSVIIGSADSKKETSVKDATILGHNANVEKEGGVALGAGSVASREAQVAGYDPSTKAALTETSATWKATNAAVSIGKEDGSMTRQITGVAAGTKATDAVNVAQLQKAIETAQASANDTDTHVKAGTYAVTTVKDAAGKDTQGVALDVVDKDGKTVGNVTITDVAKASDVGDVSKLATGSTVVDAINNVNTKVDTVDKKVDTVDKKVGDLQYGAEGQTNVVTNGDSVTKAIGDLDKAIGNASTEAGKHTIVSTKDRNLTVENVAKKGEAANYQLALNKDITVDSVTAKTVTSDTVKTKNLSVSESASIGDVTINKGNQGTIDGLKNTAWDAKNITSGRAATEDQVKAATKNAVNYDDDTSKTITLREDTTIKNVANTSIEQGSKNAVNAGTVYNETRVKQDGKYVKASNTAGENLSVLDNQVASNSSNITNLNGRVNNLDSKVNKVGAGAAALAALHPLDFDPEDKWDFAVGYGNYRDANSVAVGAFYRPDDDTMFSVGTNFGNGENMINAGVSFKFGPKGKSQVRPGSTQEITELRATVARQDDQLKKQDSEIKELKAMVQQLMAKQDKQATTK